VPATQRQSEVIEELANMLVQAGNEFVSLGLQGLACVIAAKRVGISGAAGALHCFACFRGIVVRGANHTNSLYGPCGRLLVAAGRGAGFRAMGLALASFPRRAETAQPDHPTVAELTPT